MRSLGLGSFGCGQRDLDAVGVAENEGVLGRLLFGKPVAKAFVSVCVLPRCPSTVIASSWDVGELTSG